MKSKKLLILSAALLLTLAACGGNNGDNTTTDIGSPTTTVPTTNNSEPTTTNGIITPTTPTVETYVVVIRNTVGVNIVSDKTTAQEGEKVTLTVTVEENYTLQEVTVNGTKINAKADGKYTFFMPNEDVIVRAKVTVEGEFTISGDVSALLVNEGNGLYVARGVEIENTSGIYVNVKVGNESKKLGFVDVDELNSFADISLVHNSSVKISPITLAGKAKYDIFYDSNKSFKPVYIQRVEVTSLPTAPEALHSLFDGQVQSEWSVYPTNVNGVHYTNTQTQIDYSWTLYDESTSHAVVKKLNTENVMSNVYKTIEGNTLIVVDDYIESKNDQTKRDDTEAFSGKYKIVEEKDSGMSKYQVFERNALREAIHYSHDMVSVEFEMDEAYRTGFDTSWNEGIKDYKIDIKSSWVNDNEFTTTVDSYRTIAIQDEGEFLHTVYDVDLKFTKAGALISATLKETAYDETAYDFTALKFLNGGQARGNVVREITVDYTYGAPTTTECTFDTAPYFTQSFKTLKVVNPKIGKDNVLSQYDKVENYTVIESLPETALDTWQFGVIESNNTNVIEEDSTWPGTYVANGLGSATITFGNHTTNDVKASINVTVGNDVKIWYYWMQAANYMDYDFVQADRATVIGGRKLEVIIDTHPNNAPLDFEAVSSNTDLLELEVNGDHMIFDATKAVNLIKETVVKVTINSNNYDDGSGPTVFNITIKPGLGNNDGIVGTWVAASGETIVFTEQTKVVSTSTGATRKTGYATVGSSTYNFTYVLSESTGRLTMYAESYEQNWVVIYEENTLQVILYTNGWGGYGDIIGEYYEDEEGYPLDDYCVYVTFTKQS